MLPVYPFRAVPRTTDSLEVVHGLSKRHPLIPAIYSRVSVERARILFKNTPRIDILDQRECETLLGPGGNQKHNDGLFESNLGTDLGEFFWKTRIVVRFSGVLFFAVIFYVCFQDCIGFVFVDLILVSVRLGRLVGLS